MRSMHGIAHGKGSGYEAKLAMDKSHGSIRFIGSTSLARPQALKKKEERAWVRG